MKTCSSSLLFTMLCVLVFTTEIQAAQCPENCDPTSNFGCVIGEFDGVQACSNGYNTASSNCDIYSTCAYQCVEYIKRFYQINPGISYAADYYDVLPAVNFNFRSYPNGGTVAPQLGDILGFDDGAVGHVAIIKEIGPDYVIVVQQNWSRTNGYMTLGYSQSNGHYRISNASNYVTEGWIRNLQYNPPSTCTPVSHRYPVMMTSVSVDSNGKSVLTTWYQPSGDAYAHLSQYGPVAELSSAYSVKKWFAGNLRNPDNNSGLDDLLVSADQWNMREYLLFASTGDGGFYGADQWFDTAADYPKKSLLGNMDDDSDLDLLIGEMYEENDYHWTWNENLSYEFSGTDAEWKNNAREDGAFGEQGNQLLSADLDGNGKVEVLRGSLQNTSDCSGKFKWNRLKHSGDVETIAECWGVAQVQFLVGNVDGDGESNISDELLNIKTTDSKVEVYVGKYNTSTNKLETDRWANDVGGTTGMYFLADIDQDGYKDLVRWNENGKVVWMRNLYPDGADNNANGQIGAFENQDSEHVLIDLPRSSGSTLLFGNFGTATIYDSDSCASSTSSGSGTTSSSTTTSVPTLAKNTWAQVKNGVSESSVSMAVDLSGNVHLAARGVDDAVYYTYRSASGLWNEWLHVQDGYTTSPPVLAVDKSGVVHLVVRSSGNRLYYTKTKGSATSSGSGTSALGLGLSNDGWNTWTTINDASSYSSPALTVDSSGVVHMVIRATNDVIMYTKSTTGTSSTSSAWTAWSTVKDGATGTAPSMVSGSDGRLHLAAISVGGSVYYTSAVSTGTSGTAPTWNSWTLVQNGNSPSTPSLALDSSGMPHLAVRGADNGVYYSKLSSSGVWSSWVRVQNGTTLSSPGIAVDRSGKVHLMVHVSDYRLFYINGSSSGWNAWSQLEDGSSPSEPSLAVSNYDNTVHLAARSAGGTIYYRYQ